MKKLLSGVSQAAGILDEVDMEVDENISRRSSIQTQTLQRHSRLPSALKNRVRQLEVGYKTVTISWRRGKSSGTQT